MQFALGADAVGIVAAVDVTEIQGGHRYQEGGILVPGLQLGAPREQLAQHLVHALQGVVAQARVAGVAGGAAHPDGLHEDALVQADGLHARGLADDGVAAQAALRIDQRLGADHGAFLVGGGEDDDGVFQLAGPVAARRLDGQGQEALHVRGAQAVEAIVGLGHGEGIVLPAAFVVGHGIGVAGQYQAVGAAPQGGDEVGLVAAGAERLDLGGESQAVEPFGEPVDHRPVALIIGGADAADGRQGDQLVDHGQESGRLQDHGVALR